MTTWVLGGLWLKEKKKRRGKRVFHPVAKRRKRRRSLRAPKELRRMRKSLLKISLVKGLGFGYLRPQKKRNEKRNF